MGHHFTAAAQQSILSAQKEAIALRSRNIEVEHLLLGLIATDNNCTHVLQHWNVSPDKVRLEILSNIKSKGIPKKEPKLSYKAARIVELAADEARRMEHNYIGEEHLLLGLLRPREAEYMHTPFDDGVSLLLHKLGFVEWEKSLRNWSLVAPASKTNLAFQVLSSFGVTLEVARFVVAQYVDSVQESIWKKAQHIITRSQQEAQLAGSGRINTGHLLMALLHDDNGTMAKIIGIAGVTVPDMRAKIKTLLYSDNELMGSKPKFTLEAKRVLEEAITITQHLGEEQVQPIRLVISILPDSEMHKEKLTSRVWNRTLRQIGRLPERDDIAIKAFAAFDITLAKIKTLCEQHLESIEE